jgi:uncharacterized protein (DUF1501 family)
VARSGDEREALVVAQQLIIATPEFQTTVLTPRRAAPPTPPPVSAKASAPYKAIVYLLMAGAADSFSVLVPHSECKAKDLYQEYVDVRGVVALPKSKLLPIDVPAGTQPCDTFALHKELPTVKKLYDAKQAVFFANTGTLVEPLNRDEYQRGAKRVPVNLFAHNVQQRSTQTVVPQTVSAAGVLGRTMDALVAQGHSVGPFSIDGSNHVLLSEEDTTPGYDIVHCTKGVPMLEESNTKPRAARPSLLNVTGASTSAMGDTWSATVKRVLDRSVTLDDALQSVELKQAFAAAEGGNVVGSQLDKVARLIAAAPRLGTDRDAFFIRLGGFDTHGDAYEDLAANLAKIDAALASFQEEMEKQGLWDDVVVITASDFGRTLTTNGAGTDHAWGGNYFMVGGAVEGGKILGKYPDDLTEAGPQNIGRGRLVPTTSWDAVWNAVARWFGVEEARMDTVLPNRKNFPKEDLFEMEEVFN